MDFEKFLRELDSLTDVRKEKIAEIKRTGLPVIVFCAKAMAQFVATELNFFGVDVEGFAVDSDFFKPDQTFCGRPVFDFATLDPKKFVFVLGMNSDWLGNNRSWEFLHDERFVSFAFLVNHISPKSLIEKDFILLHRDEFA